MYEQNHFNILHQQPILSPMAVVQMHFSMHHFTIKGHVPSPMLNGRSDGHTFLTTAIVYSSGNEDQGNTLTESETDLKEPICDTFTS